MVSSVAPGWRSIHPSQPEETRAFSVQASMKIFAP